MIDVLNPVDGSDAGQVEHHSESQVRAAIDRTCAAFPAWPRLLAKQRSNILRMVITRKVAAYENSTSSDTPACSRLPDLPPTPVVDEVDYRGKPNHIDWYRSFDRCHLA